MYFHRGFQLSFEMALDKVSSTFRGRLHQQAADIFLYNYMCIA
jgi:hypothetical protein